MGRARRRALGAGGRLRRARGRRARAVRPRGPRTASPSPGSPSIAVSSSSRASDLSTPCGSPGSSSDSSRPITWRCSGWSALWSGDAAAGVTWLARADRQAAALGWGNPSVREWTADYVAALLELGRIDDAVQVLDVWEADARRLGRDWVLAQVVRCRGLVAAAEGAVDQAASLLEQAGEQTTSASATRSAGLARCWRSAGPRRARQKRAARDAIRAALAASSNWARPPGPRGRGTSSGASAGAGARRG